MNARYYRYLYHPVTKGVVFSASIGASKGKDGMQILYLGQNASFNEAELPLFDEGEHLHAVILADTDPSIVEYVQRLLWKCDIDTVYLPQTKDKPSLESEAVNFCEVETTQEVTLSDISLKLFCHKDKLIVYIGSEGLEPSGHECVMNVKSFTSELPCRATVDAANLSCEMRCLLCQDVTQCKRHNQRDEIYFADGHLLPGTADLSECLPELKQYLAEEWKTIRFVALPEGGSSKAWNKDLLTCGTSGHRRYFIGTKNASPEIIKTVATNDAYGTFAFTDDKSGLCISGCYAER